MAAVTISSEFGAPQNKVCHCYHCFPIYLPWSDKTRCHDLSFLIVEFKASFFTLLFHLIKRLFRSLLSAIRVVSSTYLRLLIFLPAFLIAAGVSSSLAFHIIYSAYKLNKQGDSIQPWCTPFSSCNHSIVSLCSRHHAKHCFHCFPIYLPWSDKIVCHVLSFLNVEL